MFTYTIWRDGQMKSKAIACMSSLETTSLRRSPVMICFASRDHRLIMRQHTRIPPSNVGHRIEELVVFSVAAIALVTNPYS